MVTQKITATITRTPQNLFNYVVSNLREQGLNSNKNQVEYFNPDKAGVCYCAFGLIGEQVNAVYDKNKVYNHPSFLGKWLGKKITTASKEYNILCQLEAIYEGWTLVLRKDFGWDEIDLIGDKEERLKTLASKYSLEYIKPEAKKVISLKPFPRWVAIIDEKLRFKPWG